MNALRLAFMLLVSAALHAAEWKDYFEFEKIPMPAGVDPQVGGMDFLKDGRLAVAFHRGELMIYTPATKAWSLFASGLQEPLGVLAEPNGDLLVMQRAELTRLRDVDGDGAADRYETVFDGFGLSGNYHEFAFGPARDAQGNLYIALGLASNGAPVRREIRGGFSPVGELAREEMTESADWKRIAGKAGRMYSRVPWRGWVIRLSPDGKLVEPYASGCRTPDGIGFDAKGRLIVTDNQGDWRPTSPLFSVRRGDFLGHPASLVWKNDWDGGDPLKMSKQAYEKLYHPAAGLFPYGALANSPTQPVPAPAGALPAGMTGQTIIGEMNQNTLVRVLDDEVDGIYQSALVPFLDKSPLGIGNHRLAFGPDGALYVGKTGLSWAGGTGITRVRWNGKSFFSLDKLKATPGGFILRFSEPVDEATLAGIQLSCHTYPQTARYGSKRFDEQAVAVTRAVLSNHGRDVTLGCGPFKQAYLYGLDLTSLRAESGHELMGGRAWYHVAQVPR
jgi:glucose/arabinose dehydrogenase